MSFDLNSFKKYLKGAAKHVEQDYTEPVRLEDTRQHESIREAYEAGYRQALNEDGHFGKPWVYQYHAATSPVQLTHPGRPEIVTIPPEQFGKLLDATGHPWNCTQDNCYVNTENGSFWICPDGLGSPGTCYPCEGCP